jgi:hypothetical protein
VVAPAAKSPLEALNIHFSHIRQYYQELADYSDAATKINQLVNNIPYHMQSIIVIIQQEQLVILK